MLTGINNDRRDSDSDSSTCNELSIDDIMKLTTVCNILSIVLLLILSVDRYFETFRCSRNRCNI